MATKKTFRFPKGTKKISAKEWAEVLSTYEKVEVPGSVVNVSIDTKDTDVTTKEIVFHKGTLQLSLTSDKKPIYFNIPTTVHTISNWNYNGENLFFTSKILILGIGVISAEGIRGPEYLQYYSTTHVESYNGRNRDLKHLVYLGTKIDQKCGSYNLPDGCVIHVEQKKTALSILKRVNVNTVFVIPDAAEWKDFPADKLAMTMEEYNPESRILHEQIKMREELLQKKHEEEQKRQEEARERQKGRMLSTMTTSVIDPVMQSIGLTPAKPSARLLGQISADSRTYKVDIVKHESNGCMQCHLSATIVPNLWSDTSCGENLKCLVVMDVEDVQDHIQIVAQQIEKLTRLHEENRALFDKYKIIYNFNGSRWIIDAVKTRPSIALSIEGGELQAALSDETIVDDVLAVKTFADKLNANLREANEALEIANFTLERRS